MKISIYIHLPAVFLLACFSTAKANTHYVDINNSTPSDPYTNWATAATVIQDAVDEASAGDIVIVADGIYDTGGATAPGYACMNRVVITSDITVESVNGTNHTFIVGEGPLGVNAVRGVYMNAGLLSGFTITNGHTHTSGDARDGCGGGVNMYGGDGVVSNCALVVNKAYYAGGGSYYGTLNNCTVSGNGASETYSTGGGAARSTLNHCTLKDNWAHQLGGGSTLSILNNCKLVNNRAKSGGGSANGTLNNCELLDNFASYYGGGSYNSTLTNCVLTDNIGNQRGGGSYQGTLTECTLSGNSSSQGGGSSYSTLMKCALTGNSAAWEGGASYYGSLTNCRLIRNSSSKYGGGSSYSTLSNCALYDNTTYGFGGGSAFGTLNNCTISGNSANYGGGNYVGTLNNCIIYHNTSFIGSEDNWEGGTLTYCCTIPDPGGTGNIIDDPMLVNSSHIHTDSPCVGAGSAAYISGSDIDEETWDSPPSIGCDEPIPPFTGGLEVSIYAEYTNVVVGHALAFSAEIHGNVASNQWTFDDGISLSNNLYCNHTWLVAGNYDVVLTAYNTLYPDGVTATTCVQVVAASILYVDSGNATPDYPYTNWTTAATNIQDAVDLAAVTPGSIVLVTNGVYTSGGAIPPSVGFMTRVVINNNISVQSLNGPDHTFIVGEGPLGGDAVRGVYMNAGMLSGFTVTNGHTATSGDNVNSRSGGGVFVRGDAGVISNCVLVGNTASYGGGGSCLGTLNDCTITGNSAQYGGGSAFGTLNNCMLEGNSAIEGGGSAFGTLNNCRLTGNSSSGDGGGSNRDTLINCTLSDNTASGNGGGCLYSTAKNSVIHHNSVSSGSNSNYYFGTFDYSCTAPLPGGIGNIVGDPMFTDAASGNYRLATNSPCINAGSNGTVIISTDLDGHPRIVGGTVDMGAYESGFNGCFITNCIPTGAETILQWTAFPMWESTVSWSTNLVTMPFTNLSSSLAYPINSYTDTVHSAVGECFYKVELVP